MEARVKNVFAAVFKCRPDEIKEGFSMDTVASWDSLKHLTLIAALEQEFGITIEPDEIIAADTYAAVLRLVQLKTA